MSAVKTAIKPTKSDSSILATYLATGKAIKLDISKIRDDDFFRNLVLKIRGQKAAVRCSRLGSETDWFAWFIWYAVGLSGEIFSKFCKENPTANLGFLRKELQPLLESTKIYHYYLFPSQKASQVRIGTQISEEGLGEMFRNFLLRFRDDSFLGMRTNMPEPLSESFPGITSPNFFRYINSKWCKKGCPANSGDGFLILTDGIEEAEVKSTISGGVRNTFSDRQIERKFFYLSIDTDDLRSWLRDPKSAVTISVHVLSRGISSALRAIITKTNKSRKARFDFPTYSELVASELIASGTTLLWQGDELHEVATATTTQL